MKVAAENDENNHFGLVIAEPFCHGAHHSFDGVLHMLKAKTSKTQGEAEWKAILQERLKNDFHGFQHAVKTAHELMNSGFLPVVSRELNPKNKKSLMIHRVRSVCNDLIQPLLDKDDFDVPDRTRLMTDAEFEQEVYGLRNVIGGGSEYRCSVCGDVARSSFFFVPATMMWHPVGIKKGGTATAFDPAKLGKSQFIVCGSLCDELLKEKPNCPSCGLVEEIKWNDETYVDPTHLKNIPSMYKFFQALRYFDNNKRHASTALTQEETEELRVDERPDIKEFLSYMKKPVPLVRPASCKQCGKHVFQVKKRTDEDAGAWKYV